MTFHLHEALTGPDSVQYNNAAIDLLRRGWLSSDIRGIPHWPAGYPMLIAIFYAFVGVDPDAATLLGVLAVGGGMLATYALVRLELGEKTALITVALLSLSPALLSAPTHLMYEPILLAILAAATWLLSSSARHSELAFRLPAVVGAGLLLGMGATIQPKVLLTSVAFIPWFWFRRRARLRLAVAIFVLAASVGPIVLAVRMKRVTGHFGLSTNSGITMLIGANDRADGTYREPSSSLTRECTTERDPFEADIRYARCALDWYLANPTKAVVLAAVKAYYFWSPFVGPAASRSTWSSDVDVRNALGIDARTEEGSTRMVDRLASTAWQILLILTLLCGAIIAWRKDPSTAYLLLVPVVTFMFVSMISIADARFRLPVSPFYTAFVALTLSRSLAWLLEIRKHAKRPPETGAAI